MTTNFPAGLDAFTNPSATDAMDSATVPHAAQHANLNDAVEALQAKVGVDGSAVTSSLDYKLADLGKWTSYTPTLTNWTASSTSFQYAVVNELVFVRMYAVVATMGSFPSFTTPTTIGRSPNFQRVGLLDSGTTWYDGMVLYNGLNSLGLLCLALSGSFLGYYGISATTPHTWTAGDAVDGTIIYGRA